MASILPQHRNRGSAPSTASAPSQTDGSGSSSDAERLAPKFRDPPLRVFFRDARLGLSLLQSSPGVVAPWRTKNRYAELYCSGRNIWEMVLQAALAVSGLLLMIVLLLLLVAPVSLFVLYVVVWRGLIYFLYRLCYCCSEVRSNVDPGNLVAKPQESWTFVNGICVGQHWLQANVDMISTIFRRPVVSVHNRSYGLVIDIVECVVQRSFSYGMKATRDTYKHLRKELENRVITKVVVLAHSQGGIILSGALDMLLADLPGEVFEKLEIYTFGSAANHFNNPLCQPSPEEDQRRSPPRRQIGHIEHYCNEYDPVAHFGTLRGRADGRPNHFAGIVFVYKKQGGHLLNQHYLDAMFLREDSRFLEQEVDIEVLAVKRDKGAKAEARTEAAGGEGPGIGAGLGGPVLSSSAVEGKGAMVVRMEVADGEEPESGTPKLGEPGPSSSAEKGKAAMTDARTEAAGGEGPEIGTLGLGGPGPSSSAKKGKAAMTDARTEAAGGEGPGIGSLGLGEPGPSSSAGNGVRKTVKDLSRLWKYIGGGSPDEALASG